MRVLIIDDERRLAENIAQILKEREQYAVDISLDGIDGFHMFRSNTYDLVILDWMLPGMDGLEILHRIRREGKKTPVLILSARDTPEDIIRGLDCGSDDYLTKPFDMGELAARCKSLIRRSYGQVNSVLCIGELLIDTSARRVKLGGKPLNLTAMEYQTLLHLALRKGEVVSKEELLEHLYDFNWERFSNVIEVYVSSLRRKIDPKEPQRYIRTCRGQGYLLNEPMNQ
ncbi:MAG TPA: response regulator transcription factor [Anaerohalosphaeraceae bacterium]|mgnify:CR=1 FL=1|nr:response regulator transcription factor [Anaerohalosphaeraceae bacterium]